MFFLIIKPLIELRLNAPVQIRLRVGLHIMNFQYLLYDNQVKLV